MKYYEADLQTFLVDTISHRFYKKKVGRCLMLHDYRSNFSESYNEFLDSYLFQPTEVFV